MALRYLALVGANPHDVDIIHRIQTGTDLALVLDQQHLKLFMADGQPLAIGQNHGAILGHVFSRTTDAKRVVGFSEETAHKILDSRGEHLLNAFWGGYVAVSTRPNAEVDVIRDPSGALPCYWCKLDRSYLVASDLDSILRSGLISPVVDWPEIAQHLSTFDLRSYRTCLLGIHELLAGCRLTIGSDGSTSDPIWSPWDYVQPLCASDAERCAEALFETTTACLSAWAGVFPNILMGLSGGLDSSIVATTLAALGFAPACLNMVTDHAEGDERAYARIAAEVAGLSLYEKFHRLDDIDVTRPSAAHLPRPILAALGQSEYLTKVALSKEIGADAYITGIGGDNVFCHMRSATPALDRLLATSSILSAWSTIEDVCDLTGCSAWEALLQLVRRASTRDWTYKWQADHRFLTPEAAKPSRPHPWLNGSKNILPGKAVHVAMLTRIQGTIDGFPRYDMIPMMNPLLSQPIVELCLSIPSWYWINGGRDRAVARRAFARQIPKALLDRRSKGGPDTFATEVLERDRLKIHALLREGILAEKGIVDVNAVDQALAGRTPVQATEFLRLSLLTEAEVWCRHWS